MREVGLRLVVVAELEVVVVSVVALAVFKTSYGLNIMLLGKDLGIVGLRTESVVVARLMLGLQHAAFGDIVLAAGSSKVVERAHVIAVGLVVSLTFIADVLILETGRDGELRQNLEVGMRIGPDIVATALGEVAVELVKIIIALVLESE